MHLVAEPAVHLQLHGYPAVVRQGNPLALRLKGALALLAYLAEQPRPVGRETLAALLWPDADARLGRTRLRRLVHELHQAAGTTLIEGDADTLALAPGWTSDLQATRGALGTLARRLDAVPLDERTLQGLARPLLHPQAGELLHGFSLGTEAFDDWLVGQRRAHLDALARGLERLAELALQRDDATLAEAAATALLRLDSCSEAGHAARMMARALRHDAAGVENAYFDGAERLRDELGARPSPRLEAAYARAAARARLSPGPSMQPMQPLEIDYAPTGHGEVAYAAWGCGPTTIVILWGLVSNLEVALEEPRARALLDALAARHRVVMLDRRGTGLSERVGVRPDAAAAAEDIESVLDHLGVSRAWLFGSSVGGTLALDFALRQPRRSAGLLLFGTSASGAWSEDTPWALREQDVEPWVQRLTDPAWHDSTLRRFAPSAANDPWVRSWYARLLRQAGSRLGTAAALREYRALDLRERIGALRLPTLVLQRRGDRVVPFAAGRRLGAAIAGARFVALEGDDHFLWHGDHDAVRRAVSDFVAEHERGATDAEADAEVDASAFGAQPVETALAA